MDSLFCACVREGGNIRVSVGMPLTSAWIVLDQKLVQSHPTASDSHHHRAAQDPHQAQLLRVAELWPRRGRRRVGEDTSETQGENEGVREQKEK